MSNLRLARVGRCAAKRPREGGGRAPVASRHSDVSSARAMLSDPPDRATAILCEREAPRSLIAKAKRSSKPEAHRLKPGVCMHAGDGTPMLTCGRALGWPRKCELAVFTLLGFMHVPDAPSDLSDLKCMLVRRRHLCPASAAGLCYGKLLHAATDADVWVQRHDVTAHAALWGWQPSICRVSDSLRNNSPCCILCASLIEQPSEILYSRTASTIETRTRDAVPWLGSFKWLSHGAQCLVAQSIVLHHLVYER